MSDLDDLLLESKCGGRVPEFKAPPPPPQPMTPEEASLMRRAWNAVTWKPEWLHLKSTKKRPTRDVSKLLEDW
jgi:hypothetical protein